MEGGLWPPPLKVNDGGYDLNVDFPPPPTHTHHFPRTARACVDT